MKSKKLSGFIKDYKNLCLHQMVKNKVIKQVEVNGKVGGWEEGRHCIYLSTIW